MKRLIVWMCNPVADQKVYKSKLHNANALSVSISMKNKFKNL